MTAATCSCCGQDGSAWVTTSGLGHYQRLGFTTDHHDETYAFASRGNLVIHLALDQHPDTHMTSELYIHVDDPLTARFTEAA